MVCVKFIRKLANKFYVFEHRKENKYLRHDSNDEQCKWLVTASSHVSFAQSDAFKPEGSHDKHNEIHYTLNDNENSPPQITVLNVFFHN
jgi:hypothetical protein